MTEANEPPADAVRRELREATKAGPRNSPALRLSQGKCRTRSAGNRPGTVPAGRVRLNRRKDDGPRMYPRVRGRGHDGRVDLDAPVVGQHGFSTRYARMSAWELGAPLISLNPFTGDRSYAPGGCPQAITMCDRADAGSVMRGASGLTG